MDINKKDATANDGELVINHSATEQPALSYETTQSEPQPIDEVLEPQDNHIAEKNSQNSQIPTLNDCPQVTNEAQPEVASVTTTIPPLIGTIAMHEAPEARKSRNFIQRLKRRKYWVPAFIVFALTTLLSGTYIYFTSHTLPATYVGDKNMSFLTRSQLQSKLNEQAATTKIQLNKENEIIDIPLADIGASLETTTTTDMVFGKQSSFSQIMQPWKKRVTEYAYTLDQEKTAAYFSAIKKATDHEALNATIAIEDGVVSIKPEVIAKVSGVKDAESTIKTALANAQPVTLNLEVYEELPKIRAADLEKSKTQIEQIINVPVSLVINSKVITTSKNQIGSWITVTPNEAEKTVDIALDNVKVASYVESAIKPYIKPPRAQVIVKNPDGTERELAAGEDGVDVVDKKAVTAQLIEKINQRQAVRQEVPVAFANRQIIYAGDYEKWIEVDLTAKRMYAYERGNLVNTFLVTAGAPDTPTVVGEFKIQTKVRKQTMRGLNTDGSSYNVPNVEWVNYFYQDYAIHGNYWRPDSVFGNTNTSHGCVSLKNGGAEWMYNWAPVGTPVITHY